MESKYKDAVIINLQNELAELSQRLSETMPLRQSDRAIPQKFQGLEEGEDPRQKEIESLKNQVGLGTRGRPCAWRLGTQGVESTAPKHKNNPSASTLDT